MRYYLQGAALLAAISLSFSVQGQSDSVRVSPIQLSFITPLGTNGFMSHQMANRLSINIIGGVSGGVRGVEAAGVYNVTNGQVKGVQVAGFTNVAKSACSAVQLAGWGNFTKRQSHGIAAAGFMNVAAHGQTDLQAAGFLNVADSTHLQVAGFSNTAKQVNGLQAAGFLNVAKDVKGTQISGFINVAKHVKGTQIGVINICDSIDGALIGLVNIVRKNGYRAVEVGASDGFTGYAAFKIGAPRFFSVFTVGRQFAADHHNWGYGFGVGTQHHLKGKWYGQTEMISWQVLDPGQWDDDLQLLEQLKYSVSFRMAPKVEAFLGTSLNVLITDRYKSSDEVNDFAPYTLVDETGSRARVQGWIGVSAGLRF